MQAASLSAETRRGVALFRAGRDTEAAAALQRAVAEHAEPAAWQYLAAALWRAQRGGQALAVLRDAVLSAPEQVWPWRHLGAALLADGRWAQAEFALAEALRLDPGDVEALALRVQLEARAEHGAAAEQRRAACQALDSEDEEERVAALATLLDDPDPGTLTALLALSPPPPGLAARLAALGVLALGLLARAEPTDEAGARLVLSRLGALSPALARDRLTAWSESSDVAVRRRAAALLAELTAACPERYEDAALALLGDEDAAVRAPLAERCLPHLLADEAGLARLLAHPEPLVRHEALRCVVAGGDGERLRRVYGAASDAKVRREALRGFGLLGAGDLMALALWDEVGVLRAEAARLLAAAGAADALPALRERLDTETDDMVQQALRDAVERLTPPEAAEEPAGGEAEG
jgi:tetratricopeptide (TPR) repeat protein